MPIHKTSIPEILIPAGNCLASFLDANLWQRCDVNKSVCLAQTLLAAITSMTIGSNMSRCCCACVESNSNSVSYVLTNDLVKSLHFTLSTSSSSPTWKYMIAHPPSHQWKKTRISFTSEHPFDQTNPSIRQIGAGRTVKLWIGDATKHPHIQLRMRNVRLPDKEFKEPYMLNRSQERL